MSIPASEAVFYELLWRRQGLEQCPKDDIIFPYFVRVFTQTINCIQPTDSLKN